MANEVEVWGYCDANCRHRVLTLDQTADLIQEMAANGFQVPDGFIPKTAVNEIIEQNKGKSLKLFVGTQAEYDAWTGDKENTYPFITDDTTHQDLFNKIGLVESSVSNLEKRLEKLGFKQGELVIDTSNLNSETSVTLNTLKRQGNYVIGDFSISTSSTQVDSIYKSFIGEEAENKTIQFPKNFIPKNKSMSAYVEYLYVQGLTMGTLEYFTYVTITDDGYLLPPRRTAYGQYEAYYIKSIKIQFGYEAEPLE